MIDSLVTQVRAITHPRVVLELQWQLYGQDDEVRLEPAALDRTLAR